LEARGPDQPALLLMPSMQQRGYVRSLVGALTLIV